MSNMTVCQTHRSLFKHQRETCITIYYNERVKIHSKHHDILKSQHDTGLWTEPQKARWKIWGWLGNIGWVDAMRGHMIIPVAHVVMSLLLLFSSIPCRFAWLVYCKLKARLCMVAAHLRAKAINPKWNFFQKKVDCGPNRICSSLLRRLFQLLSLRLQYVQNNFANQIYHLVLLLT